MPYNFFDMVLLVNEQLNFEASSVWPNWAIFESPMAIDFLTKVAQVLGNNLAIL